MRVVQAARFGGPEVLGVLESPDPAAGRGEAVIDVAFVPTLFLDTQIRRGAARNWFPVTPPYVPGVGVAGTVRSVGADVDPAWIGRRVIADVTDAYAEQAVAPLAGLVTVPDELGLADAAALLTDGRTALRLADAASIKPGERVLVTAAAGGLGSLLVQLAHAAGGRVAAAARGERKLALARDVGADGAVDYSEPGWADRVAVALGGSVDVVLDGAGGEIGAVAFGLTVDGGRFFAYGAPGGGFADNVPEGAARRDITVHGIELVQLEPALATALTERALAEAAAGRIRPTIGRTLPLDRAAVAHSAIEAREVLGKTLLEV
jgi:NADPH2:quinone reductase